MVWGAPMTYSDTLARAGLPHPSPSPTDCFPRHTQAVAGNGIPATTSYDVVTNVNGVTTTASGSQSSDSGTLVQANGIVVKEENGQVVVRRRWAEPTVEGGICIHNACPGCLNVLFMISYVQHKSITCYPFPTSGCAH